MLKRVLLVAVLPAVAGCVLHTGTADQRTSQAASPYAATENDLSDIVAFESAAECRLAPDTRRIFDAMIEHDEETGATRGAPIEIAGLGTLQPTFSGPDEDNMVHAQLPLNGAWHDLTIIGLETGFVPNTGVHYRRIVFAEPPGRVWEELNPMGFDLPLIGGVREFGDGMTEYISVDRHGSGSALECGT